MSSRAHYHHAFLCGRFSTRSSKNDSMPAPRSSAILSSSRKLERELDTQINHLLDCHLRPTVDDHGDDGVDSGLKNTGLYLNRLLERGGREIFCCFRIHIVQNVSPLFLGMTCISIPHCIEKPHHHLEIVLTGEWLTGGIGFTHGDFSDIRGKLGTCEMKFSLILPKIKREEGTQWPSVWTINTHRRVV